MPGPVRGAPDELVVRREQHIDTRRFGGRKVQGVKCSVSERLQFASTLRYSVVYFGGLGSLREQRLALNPPFGGGIPADFLRQSLAGDPFNRASRNQPQNELDGFGLLADSPLGLVIGQAAETAGVQINSHSSASSLYWVRRPSKHSRLANPGGGHPRTSKRRRFL